MIFQLVFFYEHLFYATHVQIHSLQREHYISSLFKIYVMNGGKTYWSSLWLLLHTYVEACILHFRRSHNQFSHTINMFLGSCSKVPKVTFLTMLNSLLFFGQMKPGNHYLRRALLLLVFIHFAPTSFILWHKTSTWFQVLTCSKAWIRDALVIDIFHLATHVRLQRNSLRAQRQFMFVCVNLTQSRVRHTMHSDNMLQCTL